MAHFIVVEENGSGLAALDKMRGMKDGHMGIGSLKPSAHAIGAASEFLKTAAAIRMSPQKLIVASNGSIVAWWTIPGAPRSATVVLHADGRKVVYFSTLTLSIPASLEAAGGKPVFEDAWTLHAIGALLGGAPFVVHG